MWVQMKGVTMINDFIQLFENAGVPLPNENSLGNKIIPDDDKEKIINFWNWFGDSKIVDKQGRPLVVYHGTPSRFNSFDPSKSKNGFFVKFWGIQAFNIMDLDNT